MQLGMFEDDTTDYEPEPVFAEVICPRCRVVRVEGGIMPNVRRLRLLCDECKRLGDGSDLRIPHN